MREVQMRFAFRKTTILALVVATAIAAGTTTVARADAGDELRIFPSEIRLRGQTDQQTLAVQLVNAQGITRDVTGSVTISAGNSQIVSLDGQKILPLEDGETKLVVELGQLKVEVPVTVAEAAQARDVSFRLD